MQRSTDLLAGLLQGIDRELPAAITLRERLHAHPELSHSEEWTAATISEALPVDTQTLARTGRLAVIGAGADSPGGVVVRAELDGLPVPERTGVHFQATGGAMHACGHDVHMAALVALARAAHPLAGDLPAPLLALFQPSEEDFPSGAQELAEGELAALSPAALVAAHLHPEVPWGSIAIDAGVVNASCDAFSITIHGEQAHSAYPHLGRDPILALSEIILSLNSQLARRIDPLHPATLTVTLIEGGVADNVIPSLARARGTLRAYTPEDRETLTEMARQVVSAVAGAHGCRGTLELTLGEPPLDNDPAIVSLARSLSPAAGLTPAGAFRSCGSDDFSFFTPLAPLAMAFVGLAGAEGFLSRPLHHPEFLPPAAAVGAVARAQAVLYISAASQL
jgi:amidohydrolase